MDMQNRLKITLEGKISRIETFIESANGETDSVEIKVKVRTPIQLQKNVEELCNNYYAIPNVKEAELTAIEEDLHLLEVRLESLEVYADKPQTLDHLEDNIRRVIADIRPQILEKFIENWMSRLDYIRASHGSPIPEIIFKM
ncbi:uncharacterized protein TNCV_2871311 [Trichonephila clavipes]|nr:uncharacterized protein TNCV_2871311 [Trichonephila clavipes]